MINIPTNSFPEPDNGYESHAEWMEYLTRAYSELHKLKPGFDEGNYILRTGKDLYEVTTTQRLGVGDGSTAGSIDYKTTTTFTNWDKAKEAYFNATGRLESTITPEELDILAQNPFLELNVDGHNISFSRYRDYDPKIVPSEIALEIPDEIKKYFPEDSNGRHTYNNTIEKEGWEDELFGFIEGYLQNEGKFIADPLGIAGEEDLTNLTPQQAADLSIATVIFLRKFDYSQTGATDETRSDKCDTYTLLREGLENIKNPDWPGNGICRHFACMTKAVFEALKANQKRKNRLQSTYCQYNAGDAYDPIYRKPGSHKPRGHAWNTFLTVSKKGDAEATVIDTTYATPTREGIYDLDHTPLRIENAVFKIGKASLVTNDSSQLGEILEYYHEVMSENKRYPDRAVYLTAQQIRMLSSAKNIPKIPLESLEELLEYIPKLGMIGLYQIEPLHRLKNHYPEEKQVQEKYENILTTYLKKALPEGSRSRTQFGLITPNDSFQKEIYEQIKSNELFPKILKENLELRSRLRSLQLGDLGPFSPENKPVDAKELNNILHDHSTLKNLHINTKFNCRKEPENHLPEFYKAVRKSLRDLNPEKYDDKMVGFEDFTIIYNYHNLKEELRFGTK